MGENLEQGGGLDRLGFLRPVRRGLDRLGPARRAPDGREPETVLDTILHTTEFRRLCGCRVRGRHFERAVLCNVQ
jgi:hypothetical protein